MTVIISGQQRFYDQFKAGCAVDPTDKSFVMFTFQEKDNETVHIFKMEANNAQQFVNLINQTIAGTKIEVVGADQMPKGGPRPIKDRPQA